jgi:hypothetical protein
VHLGSLSTPQHSAGRAADFFLVSVLPPSAASASVFGVQEGNLNRDPGS